MLARIPFNGVLAARSLGLVAGLLVVAAALLAWRVPTVPAGAGAEVSFKAVPTGELAISQGGAFVDAPALIPSSRTGGAGGTVVVTNQSPASLAVTLRALPSTDDLDDLLQVEVTAGASVVYQGSLGDLRRWTTRVLVFRSGASQAFTLRSWIPLTARSGWRAQHVDVDLQLRTRPVLAD